MYDSGFGVGLKVDFWTHFGCVLRLNLFVRRLGKPFFLGGGHVASPLLESLDVDGRLRLVLGHFPAVYRIVFDARFENSVLLGVSGPLTA